MSPIGDYVSPVKDEISLNKNKVKESDDNKPTFIRLINQSDT